MLNVSLYQLRNDIAYDLVLCVRFNVYCKIHKILFFAIVLATLDLKTAKQTIYVPAFMFNAIFFHLIIEKKA